MDLLSLRLVGVARAMINVRSSFSQWAVSRSWELCEELILTVGVQ